MDQTIIDTVEVVEFCSSLSQVAVQNVRVLTLNIIPNNLEGKLVPGMDITTEILNNTMEVPVQESTPKKEKKFKCSYCDFAFSLSGDLKRHETTHTGVKRFKCDVCENAFARAATLKIHKMQHSGEKPFPCDVCGAAFALSSRLKRHKMSHTGERPFTCDICNHKFIVSRDLRVHQMTHTERETKTHSCELCGTNFAHKSTLKVHKKSAHVDMASFKCKTCDTSFHLSGELKDHKKSHIGEKIFKCDTCGNSFARKLTLRRHELTHSGLKNYLCDICGSSFSRENTLKIHRMTHTGNKPFKCDVCEASFALRVRLKRHMMTHSGERPFKCDVCGATFALSNRLKRHNAAHVKKSCKNNYDKKKGSIGSHQCIARNLSNGNINRQLRSARETAKRSATKKVKPLRTKHKKTLFVCQICGNKFLQEKRYTKHIMGHESNGSSFKMSDPNTSMEITLKKQSDGQKKKKSFFCNECQFCTLSNSKFEQHKKIHHREMNGLKTHNYDTRHSSGLSKKMSVSNGSVTLENSGGS